MCTTPSGLDGGCFLLFSVEGVGGVNPTLPHIRNPTDTHWDYSNTQKCTSGPRGDPRVQGLVCVVLTGLSAGPGRGRRPTGAGREPTPGDWGQETRNAGLYHRQSTRGAGLNHRQTEKAGGSREESGREGRGWVRRPRPQQEPPVLPPQPKRCMASTPLKPQGAGRPSSAALGRGPVLSPCPEAAPTRAPSPERLQGSSQGASMCLGLLQTRPTAHTPGVDCWSPEGQPPGRWRPAGPTGAPKGPRPPSRPLRTRREPCSSPRAPSPPPQSLLSHSDPSPPWQSPQPAEPQA